MFPIENPTTDGRSPANAYLPKLTTAALLHLKNIQNIAIFIGNRKAGSLTRRVKSFGACLLCVLHCSTLMDKALFP